MFGEISFFTKPRKGVFICFIQGNYYFFGIDLRSSIKSLEKGLEPLIIRSVCF